MIKATEAYVFIIFNVSFRRSNTGTYHFNAKASELYSGTLATDEIIKDIRFWIYGDDEYRGYFEANNFYSYLKDLFIRDQTSGFFDWKYLKYFLYEYELYLTKNNKSLIDTNWNEYNVIEHIYPKMPIKTCWKEPFNIYNNREKKNLSRSLGNFILTTQKNRFNDEMCFEDRKLAFGNGTLNEQELLKYDNWNADNIVKRGLDMLRFMEERWSVDFGNEDLKKRVLFVDFVDKNNE